MPRPQSELRDPRRNIAAMRPGSAANENAQAASSSGEARPQKKRKEADQSEKKPPGKRFRAASESLEARCTTVANDNQFQLHVDIRELLQEVDHDEGVFAFEVPAAMHISPARSTSLEPEGPDYKALAAAEVRRILGCRSRDEILLGGTKDEQLRDFKRIALLLHPDKGWVAQEDINNANLALRIVVAIRNRVRDAP